MEEWKEYKLGDLCNTISDTYKGNADRVVLINTSDVLEGKCLNHQLTPNKDLKGQFKKTFLKDDILYSEIRPANKRFAYIDFTPQNYIASTKLMVIRHNDKILPQYLFYILKSNAVINELQMLAESRSGTFPQITFSELANLRIKLPPPKEQRQILSILSSLDSKIEINRRINANLEQQAQALFKSWFVDFEPFKDGEFVESELGRIPKGWKVISFKNFISPITEKAPVGSLPEYSVTNNGIIPRDSKFNKKLSKETSKNKVLRRDNLVFGMSREILNWGIMEDEIGGVSSAYNVYKIDDEIITPTYLKLYMTNRISDFNSLIGTAAREGQSLDKGALMQKNVYIPPKKILEKFFRIHSSIIALQKEAEQESRRLASLRDTLLPKLMSGELQVNA